MIWLRSADRDSCVPACSSLTVPDMRPCTHYANYHLNWAIIFKIKETEQSGRQCRIKQSTQRVGGYVRVCVCVCFDMVSGQKMSMSASALFEYALRCHQEITEGRVADRAENVTKQTSSWKQPA